jgi:acyl carrier protein
MAASLSIFGSEMELLEERVTQLVAKHTGVNVKKLSIDLRLAQDIGMDGDDAVELFETYSREFSVNIEELTQIWATYFLPEGFPFGIPFAPTGEITIRDLVESAR